MYYLKCSFNCIGYVIMKRVDVYVYFFILGVGEEEISDIYRRFELCL